MRKKNAAVRLACGLLFCTLALPLHADESWDTDALERRGITPEQLEALENQDKMPVGKNLVDISLNGELRGSWTLEVSPQRIPCFTPELLASLGLPSPETLTGCYDWAGEHPEASLIWQPETQTLSIVVPPQWLQPTLASGETGGFAVSSNYNYYSTLNVSPHHRSRSAWLALDSNVNLANWRLNSQQRFQQDPQGSSTQIDSTYLEHYLGALNKILQAGEIMVSNTLFALSTIYGVQLTPDDTLSVGQTGSGVSVEGVANTPQARVDIRQYGQLIYSTLVPAGPFYLSNIPVQNLNENLDVTVVETRGDTQHFIVPVTALGGRIPDAPGYSLAAGRLKRMPGSDEVPAILTLDQHWQPAERWSLRSGVLLSGRYQSLAASVSGVPAALTGHSFQLQSVLVQNNVLHQRSAQLRFTSNHRLTDRLSLSLGISKNTPGFVSLEQAHYRRESERGGNDQNNELSVSLSWSQPLLGNLSFSHSQTRGFRQRQVWRYYTLSWNRALTRNSRLSLNASQGGDGRKKNRNLMLNLNWSLDERRFRHYYRTSNNTRALGSEISAPLNDSLNYSLALDDESSSRNRSLQASLDSNLRYTSLSLAAQRDNQRNGSYSLSGSGAVVLHPHGITFTGNRVQDTFALLQLSRPLAGIAVETPSGISWTDWQGQAVIPGITPWHENSVDVVVDKLPKNLDVANGHRSLRLARGTVKHFRIKVLSERRVLLTIRLADGELLPKGSTLWDGKTLVTEAVDDGVVFLTSAADEGHFRVKLAHSDAECRLDYRLDAMQDEQSLYDKADVSCL